MGAEGTVVGTVPVNGLLLDVDGIDVRVPANAVEYLNEMVPVNAAPAIFASTGQPMRARKVWGWLGCISIVVLLCIYVAYAKRYGPDSDYHTGFLIGSASFSKEDLKALDCLTAQFKNLTQTKQHLRDLEEGRVDPSAADLQSVPPVCGVKADYLNEDSAAMREAMDSLPEYWREGFKDGWRDERQKVLAGRHIEN